MPGLEEAGKLWAYSVLLSRIYWKQGKTGSNLLER